MKPAHSVLENLAPLLLGLAAVTAACERTAPGAGVAVRDSGGVQWVEYGPGVPVAEWRLTDRPDLSIGTLSGSAEYELYQPLHALRLPDGGVVIANQGTEELRFYAADGVHVRTVGRKGGGPGEFEDLWGVIRLRGDSLGAWDWTAKRLTVYDAAGTFARVVSARDVSGFAPRLGGALGDGSFAIAAGFDPMAAMAAGSGVRDDSITVLRIDLDDGTVLDSLGPFPADQRYVQVSEDGLWMRSLPYGRRERIDVAAGRLYVGDDRRGEVRFLDPAGGVERVVRRVDMPRRVADADLARYREEQLDGLDADERREAERRLDQIPPADHLPRFDDLFADPLGRIWIAEHSPLDASERPWMIHDRDGRPLATIRLPTGMRPLDAGADYLLVYTRDDLDVERVLLYTIQPIEESA